MWKIEPSGQRWPSPNIWEEGKEEQIEQTTQATSRDGVETNITGYNTFLLANLSYVSHQFIIYVFKF